MLLFIVLGSILYGAMAVRGAIHDWQLLPQTAQQLAAQHTLVAETQMRYLDSPWYRGQIALTLVTGICFLFGAIGVWQRAAWGRLALFGAAWLAMAQLAWTLITSLEWFRRSGAGMLYQVNVLNVAWVLLVLAIAPTERLVRR